MPNFCEALESRMFLSAVPIHKATPTPTQVADLQAIATAQASSFQRPRRETDDACQRPGRNPHCSPRRPIDDHE